MGSPTSAAHTARIMRMLARLHPELWDLFHPHGPVLTTGAAQIRSLDGGSEVALNPQPLPPRELLRFAIRRTTHGVAEATIGAHQSGRDIREIVQEIGDDWCPTPPHRTIPWPKRWPAPWPPGEPSPVDPELATPAVQAAAGLAFQGYADGIADEKLCAAFGELADRLFEAAFRNADYS
ncbi:hypothetical protein FCH28_08335 [Streptomyces piniterrae]|uniref:Uncharacterized protein n=1 Tax=Streptomyces piniterrae TaxID=2571125 RepID=A0A4U0P417_9ACTN|nr:hypothetical protein [Streptomyces piniterrae]TJZ57414.1 hypothetical protein FCH28_08335 [Streptomyces piniterrae]